MMHPLRHRRTRERLVTTLIASLVRSIMSKSMWVLVPALCAAPLASAEIFKCVAKNGGDLYQNFPCQFDSLGSSQAAGSPVDVASRAKSSKATEPRVGMTPDEVRAIWGEPVEATQDEPRQGRIEIWRYGETKSVQFDHKHRVVAVQR